MRRCRVSSGVMKGEERTRLLQIYRTWQRVCARRVSAVWAGASSFFNSSSIAGLVGIGAVPVLAPLDSALWSDPVAAQARTTPSFLSGVVVGWALLVGCLVQAGLVDRFLARQTAEERTVRGWVRFARLASATVPLFGFYTVPGWRFLLDRCPGWAFHTERQSDPYRLEAPPQWALVTSWLRSIESTSRWLASIWVFLSLYVLEMFVLLLAGLWLGAGLAAWAFSIAFHLGAALGMAFFFAGQARRAKLSRTGTVGLCLLSLAWLPPIPFLPLAGFLLFIFVNVEAREKTLAHQLYASRTTADRQPGWRVFKARLRALWEDAPTLQQIAGPPPGLTQDPVGLGQVDAHLTDFFRVRSLSLPLEAAWFTWTSLRLAGDHPWISGSIHGSLDALATSALILGLVGLLLVAVHFIRRLLRATTASSPRDRYSCARAFAFTQLGLAAGLWIGEALYTRATLPIAVVAGAAGLLGILVYLGPLFLELLRPVPELFKMDIRQQTPWLLFCPLLLAASLRFFGTKSEDLEGDWRVLQALIELAPLLGIFPGIQHLNWLLRPFPAKKIFSRELPLRVRATLAFFTFTGLLPLGGLAIPAWIAIRRRGWPPV